MRTGRPCGDKEFVRKLEILAQSEPDGETEGKAEEGPGLIVCDSSHEENLTEDLGISSVYPPDPAAVGQHIADISTAASVGVISSA